MASSTSSDNRREARESNEVVPTYPNHGHGRRRIYDELLTLSARKARRYAGLARSEEGRRRVEDDPSLAEWFEYVAYLAQVKTCRAPQHYDTNPYFHERLLIHDQELMDQVGFEYYDGHCVSTCMNFKDFYQAVSIDPRNRPTLEYWMVPVQVPNDHRYDGVSNPVFDKLGSHRVLQLQLRIGMDKETREIVSAEVRGALHHILFEYKGRQPAAYHQRIIWLYNAILGIENEDASKYEEPHHFLNHQKDITCADYNVLAFTAAVRGDVAAAANLYASSIVHSNECARYIRKTYEYHLAHAFLNHLCVPRSMLEAHFDSLYYILWGEHEIGNRCEVYDCMRHSLTEINTRICTASICRNNSLFVDYSYKDLASTEDMERTEATRQKHLASLFLAELMQYDPSFTRNNNPTFESNMRSLQLGFIWRLWSVIEELAKTNPWFKYVIEPLKLALLGTKSLKVAIPDASIFADPKRSKQLQSLALFVAAFHSCHQLLMRQAHEAMRTLEIINCAESNLPRCSGFLYIPDVLFSILESTYRTKYAEMKRKYAVQPDTVPVLDVD